MYLIASLRYIFYTYFWTFLDILGNLDGNRAQAVIVVYMYILIKQSFIEQ